MTMTRWDKKKGAADEPRRVTVKRGESGQTTALFACALSAILICLAFAVDLGLANFDRTRTSDQVQQSLSEATLPATSLLVKNSATPGEEMTRALAESLRREGFTGSIEAYYYEPDITATRKDVRVYVFGINVECETKALFGRLLGTDGVPTRVLSWAHAIPYSSYETYKPATPANGVLRVGAGDDVSAGAWTPVTDMSEYMMPGVSVEVERAVAEALAL